MALLLLIASLPYGQCIRDSVDVIEINHVCDSNAQPVFGQAIFWRWYRADCRYHVVAWRRYGPDCCIDEPPTRHRSGWSIRWRDRGVLREVSAPILRETWTQHDPEVDDREWLPQDQRIGLSKPRQPK